MATPVKKLDGLTKMHRRILSCLGEGYCVKEIASEVGLHHKTVWYHVSTIYRLLGLHGLPTLTRLAISLGLSSMPILLLVTGCVSPIKTQSQSPPLPKVATYKSLVTPKVVKPSQDRWIKLQYPVSNARLWYLQESSDNKSWTNVWQGGIPAVFSAGTPTGDFTVIMPTNATYHFWRMLGTQ